MAGGLCNRRNNVGEHTVDWLKEVEQEKANYLSTLLPRNRNQPAERNNGCRAKCGVLGGRGGAAFQSATHIHHPTA
ncbi:hypothetical protein RB195_003777 [Necator americanus]|uniref:Uncharacterized protein n=1 Tax=Necator americanus TaxID=51031 RepID=A0ABR1DQ56_NECAM